MTQPTLLMQARQGDETAIATLLNRALVHKQITATVQLTQGCLDIALCADPLPDPKPCLILLDRELSRIHCPMIQSVTVTGQTPTATIAFWHEEFTLGTQAIVRSTQPYQDIAFDKESSQLEPSKLQAEGRNSLIAGFVLGSVLFAVPLLNTLFRGFLVLVHEAGHAVTHWLFGRPALPTVNVLHGGGITLVFEQSIFVIGLVYLAIGGFAYLCRFYPRMMVLIGIATALYTICLATPTNTMLSVFMGHGMELVAIAVCLYLATSGRWCRFTGDRSIYAMLGFFTLFADVQFSWKLARDPDFQEWYLGGIGNVIDNDFVILAKDYFRVSLPTIANVFLVGCLIAPAIAFLYWRYQSYVDRGFYQLLRTK
jgi:hypothetical protein